MMREQQNNEEDELGLNIEFQVKERLSERECYKLPEIIDYPYPIKLNMLQSNFNSAVQRLGDGTQFLRYQHHKLESPRLDSNSQAALERMVFSANQKIREDPFDLGFGAMYLSIYGQKKQYVLEQS